MTQAAPGSSPVNRKFRRAARWWLAAGAFVLGLLAGVVSTGLLIQGPPSSVAAPTGVPGTTTSSETASTAGPSSMASPSSGASVQIVVNDACLRAINEAQDAYNAINKIGDAVRQLNLSTLEHHPATATTAGRSAQRRQRVPRHRSTSGRLADLDDAAAGIDDPGHHGRPGVVHRDRYRVTADCCPWRRRLSAIGVAGVFAIAAGR